MLRLERQAGDMENKTEDTLPKIAAYGGTVHRQFVKCGKASCKCARGELHGAYYYHFVRVNGKLKKRYLKPGQIEQVQDACLKRQEERRAQRAKTRQVWQSLREIIAQLRQLNIGR
jgi:uncharacterized protein DUF6788